MKRIISLGCTLMLMVGIVAAQDTLTQSGFRLVRGKIETPGENTMKVKDGTETNSYQITDDAKIDYEGKKISDLKAGDEVTLVYYQKGGKNVIREISNFPTFQGKITSIADGMVTFKDVTDKTWTVATNKTTRYSLADNPTLVTSMASGDNCNVIYSRNGETYIARYIDIKSNERK
jgi:Cu/Ag efflux protein CusF